jgi:imidazolonepropionase-like amidohydrolase
LRAIDGLNFTDGYFADAVRAGVTAVLTGCGSTNPIGGDFIAVKTAGRCADEMLIRKAAIKFALGKTQSQHLLTRTAPLLQEWLQLHLYAKLCSRQNVIWMN